MPIFDESSRTFYDYSTFTRHDSANYFAGHLRSIMRKKLVEEKPKTRAEAANLLKSVAERYKLAKAEPAAFSAGVPTIAFRVTYQNPPVGPGASGQGVPVQASFPGHRSVGTSPFQEASDLTFADFTMDLSAYNPEIQ
jgi:hypothetical protein